MASLSEKLRPLDLLSFLFSHFQLCKYCPNSNIKNSPLMYIDDFCIQTPCHALGFPTSLNLSILSVLASTYCHRRIFSQRTKICLMKFSGDYSNDGHIIPHFQVSQT